MGSRIGIDVTIRSIENPRVEPESHYYNPVYSGLKDLSLDPIFLTDDVLLEIMAFVQNYRDNIMEEQMIRNVKWK